MFMVYGFGVKVYYLVFKFYGTRVLGFSGFGFTVWGLGFLF